MIETLRKLNNRIVIHKILKIFENEEKNNILLACASYNSSKSKESPLQKHNYYCQNLVNARNSQIFLNRSRTVIDNLIEVNSC